MNIKINWLEENAKEKLTVALDDLLNNTIKKISISNIVSGNFVEEYEVEEVTDFNGWECDWWSSFSYKGHQINVYGCAWYGTIELSI